jgi:hypothetical protein
MNIRILAVVAFSALAPLAAHADAPSGDFHELFAAPAVSDVPSTRAEHRNYVEFTIGDLTRAALSSQVTVEQVRQELSSMPPQAIGA